MGRGRKQGEKTLKSIGSWRTGGDYSNYKTRGERKEKL